MSKKGEKWKKAAEAVLDHVENYVVPQYGDDGQDPATDYDFEDCCKQAERYLRRRKSNSRPGQERRDILKTIHWLSIALEKQEMEATLYAAR